MLDWNDNIIRLAPWNGRVQVFGLTDVLDRVEKGSEQAHADKPACNSLRSRDVLTVKVQSQFWSTSIVKETIMVFYQLRKKNQWNSWAWKLDSVFWHTTNSQRTGSEGAGMRTKAGKGGDPPLRALDCIRAVATDRRSNGVNARDAMVDVNKQ